MIIEVEIISQQLKLLKDRPEAINQVFNLVHRQVEESKRNGLSEREYKKRLNQTLKRLDKHFK